MIKGLDVTIKRSDRKTLSIYVERDGGISVLAPENMQDKELKEVLEKKEYLIQKHHAQWDLLNGARVDREFVNGQSYMYLGRNYRLRIVTEREQAIPLQLKNGYFCLKKSEKLKASQRFIEFYKEKGVSIIEKQAQFYAAKLGVKYDHIRVIDLKNRWASCSDKKRLNFHWKCVMAPFSVINYIIVHELVHFKYKKHDRKFWNEVDKVIPDYKSHLEWLRSFGASMAL